MFPICIFLGSPARQFSPSLCDQSRPRTSGASYLQNLLRVPPDPTSTESFLLKGSPSMSELIQGHRLSKEKRLTVAPPGKHFFLGCMWCKWQLSRQLSSYLAHLSSWTVTTGNFCCRSESFFTASFLFPQPDARHVLGFAKNFLPLA